MSLGPGVQVHGCSPEHSVHSCSGLHPSKSPALVVSWQWCRNVCNEHCSTAENHFMSLVSAGEALQTHLLCVLQASSFLAALSFGVQAQCCFLLQQNHQHRFPLMLVGKARKMSTFPGSLPSLLRQIKTFFNFNYRQVVL